MRAALVHPRIVGRATRLKADIWFYGLPACPALARGWLLRGPGRGSAGCAAGRGGAQAQPSAAILDSRTLRFSLESGARAGMTAPSASGAPNCTLRSTRWAIC